MATATQTNHRPVAKEPPAPGVYPGVPFEEYKQWDAVSNSSLAAVLRSPAQYRWEIDNPRESTDAMSKGTLTHIAESAPLEIAERYVVMPDQTVGITRKDGSGYSSVRATTQYKDRVAEFEASNADKEIVTQQMYDDIKEMNTAIGEHERAPLYLRQPGGRSELSFVWDDPDTRLRCKARADRVTYSPLRITDLKSTRDAGNFEREIYNFAYHRQAAFYSDGLFFHSDGAERYEFCIVAVESAAPFQVRAAPVSEEAIAQGRRDYQKALRRIADCRASGEWPGYDDPAEWNLPAWAQKNSEAVTLKIGGKEVNL